MHSSTLSSVALFAIGVVTQDVTLTPAMLGNVFLEVETNRGFPDCQTGPLSNTTVCNQAASPLARATTLVARLTPAEKFENINALSEGVPRLGIPSYIWWNEALHGVATSNGVTFLASGNFSSATSFPMPILSGAAFDDDMIRDIASVISTEARAFNNFGLAGLNFWTPNINPFKDPRWGRGQETPGEDPYHLSSYVKALVEGLQGRLESTSTTKVIATCKHLAAYDVENWNGNERTQFDDIISQQDLVEYYLKPFQSCVRDAGVGSVMCSYNAVNGVPTCASDYLIDTVLRQHWNFTSHQGFVVSDCGAVANIFSPHGFAATREQTVADAITAGVDVDCGTYFGQYLPGALNQSLIKETNIDQALIRQYSTLIQTGYFDGPTALYRNLTAADVNTPHAQALARRAASAGMVLLKNDGVLPLTSINTTNITVVGYMANATTYMLGNYFGVPPFTNSFIDALQAQNPNAVFAPGILQSNDISTLFWPQMNAAVEAADLVIFVGGLDDTIEAEGLDRVSIGWDGTQLDIIQGISSMGKPTIVARFGGGQLDDTPLKNNPNISAIVWVGYPGQDGGPALIDVLSGIVAPAGRLPVTQYPADYISQIPMTDMSLRPNATTGSPGRTYQWFEGEAVYDFGYGIHYTNFSVHLSAGATTVDTSTLLTDCTSAYLDLCLFSPFNVMVQNTGSVTSDYVVLAFIAGEHGPTPYPIKRLVNYQRLHSIAPQSSAAASLDMTLGSLGRVVENGSTILFPGSYSLMIDTQPLACVDFTITGDALLLDDFPIMPEPIVMESNYFVGGFGSQQSVV